MPHFLPSIALIPHFLKVTAIYRTYALISHFFAYFRGNFAFNSQVYTISCSCFISSNIVSLRPICFTSSNLFHFVQFCFISSNLFHFVQFEVMWHQNSQFVSLRPILFHFVQFVSLRPILFHFVQFEVMWHRNSHFTLFQNWSPP